MMMNMQFGASGIFMMLLVAALLIFPFWKLLPRFGYPAWLAFVAIIPIGALILLWVLAFSNKPVEGAK